MGSIDVSTLDTFLDLPDDGHLVIHPDDRISCPSDVVEHVPDPSFGLPYMLLLVDQSKSRADGKAPKQNVANYEVVGIGTGAPIDGHGKIEMNLQQVRKGVPYLQVEIDVRNLPSEALAALLQDLTRESTERFPKARLRFVPGNSDVAGALKVLSQLMGREQGLVKPAQVEKQKSTDVMRAEFVELVFKTILTEQLTTFENEHAKYLGDILDRSQSAIVGFRSESARLDRLRQDALADPTTLTLESIGDDLQFPDLEATFTRIKESKTLAKDPATDLKEILFEISNERGAALPTRRDIEQASATWTIRGDDAESAYLAAAARNDELLRTISTTEIAFGLSQGEMLGARDVLFKILKKLEMTADDYEAGNDNVPGSIKSVIFGDGTSLDVKVPRIIASTSDRLARTILDLDDRQRDAIVFLPQALSAARDNTWFDDTLLQKRLDPLVEVAMQFHESPDGLDISQTFANRGIKCSQYTEGWLGKLTYAKARYEVEYNDAVVTMRYGIAVSSTSNDGNSCRIYFAIDPGTRRFLVGHVGRHLPTLTNRKF